MADTKGPVGRIDFVLRILLITALGRASAFLFSRDVVSRLTITSRYLQALEGVVVFGFLGIYLIKAITGRLLDTGLPRWYRYPVFLVWVFSNLLPIIWPKSWPIGFALIAILLLVGGLIPSKLVQVSPVPLAEAPKDDKGKTTSSPLPSKLRIVGPKSFLRSLLTIACLSFPLILLHSLVVQSYGVWMIRICYLVLGVVWLANLLGRLEDADLLSSSWLGYFMVAAVLLMRIIRRTGSLWQVYGRSISDTARGTFPSVSWLKFVNGYEMLALFLLIQVPLALFPSKRKSDEPTKMRKAESKFGRLLAERRKTQKRFLVGRFAFLRRLLVLAVCWVPLIHLDTVSNGGIGSWIARFGYFVLIYAWVMNLHGRFEDAGWVGGWYGAQFCLVVSVACLMPFAVHWVNAYGALAIFVLFQIPTVYLKSKPRFEYSLVKESRA